jgi:hypothetical protein
MPFDPINLRDVSHRYDTLPPTPPERGGPRRIVVNIEIVDRRTAQNALSGSRSRFPALLGWLLLLLLLASLAHAQGPTERGHQRTCHRYSPDGGLSYNTTCN